MTSVTGEMEQKIVGGEGEREGKSSGGGKSHNIFSFLLEENGMILCGKSHGGYKERGK